MHMLYFKPAPIKTVEQAPVKKVIAKAPIAPRLVLSPNGTLVTIDELHEWDSDKRNRAGE